MKNISHFHVFHIVCFRICFMYDIRSVIYSLVFMIHINFLVPIDSNIACHCRLLWKWHHGCFISHHLLLSFSEHIHTHHTNFLSNFFFLRRTWCMTHSFAFIIQCLFIFSLFLFVLNASS